MRNPKFWWNDYVGVPYRDGGSDRSGCDCWGLVRMVLAERFGQDVPAPDTLGMDRAAMANAMLAAREAAWEPVADPSSGDVVLLRVEGQPSHVGIVTLPGWMLHALEGQSAVVESYRAGRWAGRVQGVYRYAGARVAELLAPEGEVVRVIGCPSPVTTTRIDALVPVGLTLAEIIDQQCEAMGVPRDLRLNGHAYVGPSYVPREQWAHVRPMAGQVITFRIYPGGGGGGLRTALMIGVMVAAIAASAFTAGLSVFAVGANGVAGTVLGMGGAAWGAIAGGAVSLIGSLVVNMLAPVAMPKSPQSIDREDIYSITAGRNQVRQYQPLPVVLGFHRFAPDYATKPYTELVDGGKTQYLRAGFCAGYGPLAISDMRIGDTHLSRFQGVEHETRAGRSTDTALTLVTRDVDEESVGLRINPDDGWISRTTGNDVDEIQWEFSWPGGLYVQSSKTGKIWELQVKLQIQYRGVGDTDWRDVSVEVPTRSVSLQPCLTVIDADDIYDDSGVLEPEDWWLATYGVPKRRSSSTVTIPVWQWHVFSLDQYNNLVHRIGCETDSKYANPSTRLQNLVGLSRYDWDTDYAPVRIPSIGSNEEPLAWVCVDGSGVCEVVDKRDASVTGCACSVSSSTSVSFASGTVDRSGDIYLTVTAKQTSPMRRTVKRTVPRGQYDVRCRSILLEWPENEDNPTTDDVYWSVLRTVTSRKPLLPPKPMALHGLRIMASNQLNGAIEEFSAYYRRICLDYDRTSNAWVERVSRNPSAMFRYVLQCPANPRPVADSGIDLAKLEHWHTYCQRQGFTYSRVVTSMASVYDQLQEIAAAGRASVTKVDGKWSVIIDEQRTTVVQHFAPNNSWGFEGRRVLAKLPHALRITFYNERRGYIQDELIVYADGYGASNATLFETLTMPGVTSPAHVFVQGRYLLAVGRLRPEVYTLHCDIEHLVCTRGDLVRVAHDVPMWGLGSGRITGVTMSGSSCVGLTVDTPLPMVANTVYGASIRLGAQKGASRAVTVAAKPADGEYRDISITPISTNIPQVGDLLQFGGSKDCIVTAIKPDAQGNATITLCDYAPEVLDADEGPIGEFESGITLPQTLTPRMITTTPVIGKIASDESALIWGPDGSLISRIMVGFSLPRSAPASVTHCQLRFRQAAMDEDWQVMDPTPTETGAAHAQPVDDGLAYAVELRCVASDGRVGPWVVASSSHTVDGKTTPPPLVASLTAKRRGVAIVASVPEADLPPDFDRYEFRVLQGVSTGDMWEEEGVVVRYSTDGQASIPLAEFPTPRMSVTGVPYRVSVRMVDTSGNTSTASRSATVTIKLPR